MSASKTRKIRIKIVTEGKRIWIPGMPFWFIRFAWRIVRPFIKKSGDTHDFLMDLNISEIFKEISNYGPFILADIDVQEDNTKVFIEIR